MTSTPNELNAQIEEVEWHWLRLHLERGAVIIVAPELDLVEVACRIASDDSPAVGAWISEGKVAKPTLEQIALWNADPLKRFRMLIVQPYVLVQDLPSSLN